MRRAILALAALLALGAAAACTGDDFAAGTSGFPSPPPDDVVVDVVVRARSSLDFEPTEATATAGNVSFVLINDDRQLHTLTIEGFELQAIRAGGGETNGGFVNLEPGTYVYYCEVPGHRPAGMEGTLTVEEG